MHFSHGLIFLNFFLHIHKPSVVIGFDQLEALEVIRFIYEDKIRLTFFKHRSDLTTRFDLRTPARSFLSMISILS